MGFVNICSSAGFSPNTFVLIFLGIIYTRMIFIDFCKG